MLAAKRILVYGGNGALGRAVVNTFKQGAWHTVSVDFAANPAAAANVVLPANTDPTASLDAALEPSAKCVF